MKFTPTQWSTEADKLKFYNQFIKFVKSDFAFNKFPDWFYKRLSMCFGHIAHYNQHGFYETWFDTTSTKLNFLRHALAWSCCGDPTFTYCDVEKALQAWIRENVCIIDKLAHQRMNEIEQAERSQLRSLLEKYPDERGVSHV